jgi:hypothetical protein
MVMEIDTLKKFPDYVCLSYLRWLFLIESEQFREFHDNNQINKLIEEKKELMKEREDILSQMDEETGELCYKYDKAFEDASNDEDLEEKDFAERVTEIIEEKSAELREDFDSVEVKLKILRKKIRPVLDEARTRFKLNVVGNDIEQLEPVDGEIERHSDPIFFGAKKRPFFGKTKPKKIPRTPFFEDVAVQQITSLDELKKITETEEFLMKRDPKRKTIRNIIFRFDMLWRFPSPYLIDVFKKKFRDVEAVKVRPEGRVRIKEWWECLLAYRLKTKQKKSYLEIARLLGANIKAPAHQENELDASSGGHETNRVSFTLSEIDPKVWKYGHRIKRDTPGNIAYEKKQIKENIKEKISTAKKLIAIAGEGRFQGFDNQMAEHQAQMTRSWL